MDDIWRVDNAMGDDKLRDKYIFNSEQQLLTLNSNNNVNNHFKDATFQRDLISLYGNDKLPYNYDCKKYKQ